MSLAAMNRMPSRDAWLIYEFFNERFDGAFGSIASTSYDAITSALNALRLVTERGAAFTASVVKNRLAQLERIGAVVREKISGALFALSFRPVADPSGAETTPEPVDHYGGRSLFDFACESCASDSVDEKTTDSVALESKEVRMQEKPTPAPTKTKTVFNLNLKKTDETQPCPIVKNKLINKQPSKQEKPDKKPTLNALVDRLDKKNPKIAALRSKIAARVWEPWMRSDLIDRLVAAVAYGWTSASNAFAFCRHAVDQRDVYKSSNGRRGSAHIWSTLALDVKQTVENAGVEWEETRRGFELEPQKERRAPITRKISPSSDSSDVDDDGVLASLARSGFRVCLRG